jgi:uncharacterized protein (TIGR02996 family)
MTHDDFLLEILANPDDDALRLVYSDWLEERGDLLQAEFIRAQCELAKLRLDDPRYEDARKRELAVRLKYERVWRKKLPEWTAYLRIHSRRGFGGEVFTTIPYFAKNASRLFKLVPIQHVNFSQGEPYLERLLRCPQIKQLRTMEIDYCQFTPTSYRMLTACPHLTGLMGLTLRREANLDMAAAELILQSPHLRNLRTLACPSLQPGVKGFLEKRFRIPRHELGLGSV